jgi:peptidyl-prolyl cis-trans isomerase D
VALVAGFPIKKDRWDAAHKQDVDRIRASNPSVDVQLLDTEQFKYSSLERLVQDQLLGSFVQKNNITISDQRLARELQQDQFIASLRKPDGAIDIARYKEALSRQGMTPEMYEQTLRTDIAKSQVFQTVQSSGVTTKVIAQMALNPFFERREVQILKFEPNSYMNKIKPTDADIEKYYNENKNLFQVEEKIDVEYIILDIPTLINSIKVNDSDLRGYYDQNVERYLTKEERRARHLLLSVDKKLSSTEKDKIKDKAKNLLNQIKENPSLFIELAKRHSNDPGSAQNGGDLGFFQKGAMVKPFEDVAFSLKQGEISDVVETEFGFHIIQLVEIKPPVKRPYDQVKNEIENELKKQSAQRDFAEKAETFRNLVYEQADSLNTVADKLKLKVETVKGLIRKSNQKSIPDYLKSEKFLKEIFSSESIKSKQNTAAIETGANQLIAGRVLTHHPATISPLSEIKSQAELRWIATEAQRLAQEEGKKSLEAMKKGDAVSSKLGAPTLISRNDSKGLTTSALKEILSYNLSQLPAWVGVDQGNQGYVIAKINKVVPREVPSNDVARQELQQYEQWWSNAEVAAYYRALKRQFKVEIKVPEPKTNVKAEENAI